MRARTPRQSGGDGVGGPTCPPGKGRTVLVAGIFCAQTNAGVTNTGLFRNKGLGKRLNVAEHTGLLTLLGNCSWKYESLKPEIVGDSGWGPEGSPTCQALRKGKTGRARPAHTPVPSPPLLHLREEHSRGVRCVLYTGGI